MILQEHFLFAITLGYLAFVFILGKLSERKRRQTGFYNSPWLFALSLSAYCTSWTFFGSVSSATNDGIYYMATYIGPTLISFVIPFVIPRLLKLRQNYKINSLPDFLSIRYGKSSWVGVVSTFVLMAGIVPYLGLQMKALDMALDLLIQPTQLGPKGDHSLLLWITLTMILFGIGFGQPRLDTSERHPGLVTTLAVEGIFKVFALGTAALATYIAYNRLSDNVAPEFNPLLTPLPNTSLPAWLSSIFLSSIAGLLLPRQFHLWVVENDGGRSTRAASWIFPTYLLMIAIPVGIIGWFGPAIMGTRSGAELYTLSIPLVSGLPNGVILFIFLGALSSAAGMITLESVALSGIFSSHVVNPLIVKFKSLNFLNSYLLYVRWVILTFLVLSGFWFFSYISSNSPLVTMGMISFAGVAQLAPAFVLGLFWTKGTREGVVSGILVGFVTWILTMVLPGVHPDKAIAFFVPDTIFGAMGPLDGFSHGTFLSLALNTMTIIFVSLMRELSPTEQILAMEITEQSTNEPTQKTKIEFDIANKRMTTIYLFSQYLATERAKELTEDCFSLVKNEDNFILISELALLIDRVERTLSRFIGASAAYSALQNSNLLTGSEEAALTQYYLEMVEEFTVSPFDVQNRLGMFKARELDLEEKIHTLQTQIDRASMMLVESSKMAALGRMSSAIAHEINNPLTIIFLNLEKLRALAKSENIDTQKMNDHIDKIENVGKRVLAIVRGLRIFSRGSGLEPFENYSLNQIFTDTIELCRKRLKDDDIQFTINGLEKEIFLNCRPVQISQLLVNLIVNACDAIVDTPEKWLRIDVNLFENPKLVEIRVTDSGHGIPKDVQRKMFEPFFTTKEIGKGTGLGLSISKGIIESHQGDLFIDDQVPNTCFVVRLPLLLQNRPQPE